MIPHLDVSSKQKGLVGLRPLLNDSGGNYVPTLEMLTSIDFWMR